jgi:hypothetical protein
MKAKEKTAEIEQWSRATSSESIGYTPLGFFLRVSRAAALDEGLIAQRQHLSTIRTTQKFSESLQGSDIVSTEAIQLARARNQQLIDALQLYATALRTLQTRLTKEIPEQYNINRAVFSASDMEFESFYNTAVTIPYAQALLEYQQRVYKIIQSCLAQKGKKKCVVKTKDAVTLSATDKKIQKDLDAARQAFLKEFGVEYERYKGKSLPEFGK